MFSFSGFRDGHTHPLFASREGLGPDVTGLNSVAGVVAAIADYLAGNPETTWVDCGSFSPALEERSPLSRYMLDEASDVVPIVVHAEDHHSIWVNTAALERAGLSDSAPELKHARFEIDAHGVPTGRVYEWDAMTLIYAHQPRPSLESDLQALERAQRRLLAAGIVAFQDAWIDPGMEDAYLALAATGGLRIRANLAPRIEPTSWQDSLLYAKSVRAKVRALANPLLTANTVKIFIDGVIGSQTALTSEPYCTGNHGSMLWDIQDLHQMTLAADSAGFQLHFHAIGDAAVDIALDAIERLSEENGPVDRRPVIAHADLVAPQALPRLRGLGVIACVQPAWAVPGPGIEQAKVLLGSERAGHLYPLKRLLDAGVMLSFGSDWPVSPPEPCHAIVGAELRQTIGGSGVPHSPEEAITRSEALRAHSRNVAHQLGQESVLNEDIVEFSIDLETCTAEELQTATVLSVTVAGRKVWPY